MKRALAASIALHLAAAGGLALSLQPAPMHDDHAVAIDEVVVRAPVAPGAVAKPKSIAAPAPAAPTTVAPAPGAASAPSDTSNQTVTVARDGTDQQLTVNEYEKWVRSGNRAPAYPRASNQAREQGRVVIRVTVHNDGAIEAPEVETSSGFERLDQAALEAVKAWTFPAYKGAAPGLLVLRLPFKFELYD